MEHVHVSNEQKARELAVQSTKDVDDNGKEVYNAFVEAALLEMAQWKDEEYKAREEGLRETIDALDARLQKSNESGMYYFNKCNVQKQQLLERVCEWIKDNINSYLDWYDWGRCRVSKDELIDDIRKAMKGE